MGIAKTPATRGLVAALFALILAPAVFTAGPVAAQSSGDTPAEYYGRGLQDGDVVVASIGDDECGTSTVAGGVWSISVQPDACNGAAVSGATVTFTVNGVLADQTVTWEPGWAPADVVNGITLTTDGTGPVTVLPPGAPTLSRSSGLAIFDGGSIDELEAAATALCPGGANIWVNEPNGNGYLLFVANARFDIVNSAFRGAYRDGFDGPEPVIVNDCES